MFTSFRPASSSVNMRETATFLRRAMLALAAAGIVATLVELATLRHWTTTTQLIPWMVLGVMAIGVIVVALGVSPRVIRVVRAIAVLTVLSGLYGLFIHMQANYDAAILDYRYTDRWPNMSLLSKLWAAGTGQVGPAPVMAPAVLSQIAICLTLATFRHPLLAKLESSVTFDNDAAVMLEAQIATLPGELSGVSRSQQ